MSQHKLRAKLTDLWQDFGALTRDDPLFQKKRMFLYGKIIFYTKILVVVRRVNRYFSQLPNNPT